jgi:hypothetical protein
MPAVKLLPEININFEIASHLMAPLLALACCESAAIIMWSSVNSAGHCPMTYHRSLHSGAWYRVHDGIEHRSNVKVHRKKTNLPCLFILGHALIEWSYLVAHSMP